MGGHGRESRTHGEKSGRSKHGHSRKESHKHHHHHHHSSHRHHHHHSSRTRDERQSRSPRNTRSGQDRTTTKRTSARRHPDASRRYPSSSVGPGRVETVLLIMLILLGLSAIALLAVAIWLYIAYDGWPSGLIQIGSLSWTRLISYATACLLVGILLIPIILLAVSAARASTGSSARTLRLTLVSCTSLTAIILVAMTITALLFATTPPFISRSLEDAWRDTVTSSNFLISCRVQNNFNCRGWGDNSCINCYPTIDGGNYTTCSDDQREFCPPCYVSSRKKRRTRKRPVNALDHVVNKSSTSRTLAVRAQVRRKNNRVAKPMLRKGKRSKRNRANAKTPIRQNNETVELGCRRYVEWRVREFFIPMCVFTIFLLLVLLLMSWKACIDSTGR